MAQVVCPRWSVVDLGPCMGAKQSARARPCSISQGNRGSEASVFSVSHLYGFGLVDAEALVMEAKKWTAVPAQHVCVATTDKRPR